MKVIVLIFLLCLVSMSHADVFKASSAPEQIAVVELFVAEGCGLCPPAEKWLHSLAMASDSTERLIPLVYHIDYLDQRKAWVDKFAQPRFSERQRQLSRINLYKTVFTPELFVGGEVVHNWQGYGKDAIDFVNQFEAEAELTIEVIKQEKLLSINFHANATGQDNIEHSKAYLILKEDNILSEIKGGDNYGATFNHQDLVRLLIGPIDMTANGQLHYQTEITIQPDWNSDEIELVAFVQNLQSGFVLQGLSLPLK